MITSGAMAQVFVVVLALLASTNGYKFSKNSIFSPPNFLKGKTTGKTAEEASALKAAIVKASRGTANGVRASQESKDQILALTKQLEKLNRTTKLASSDKSDGKWKLVYTTSNGSSAGRLGPFVGDVTQDIEFASKQYINRVELLNGLIKAELDATWDIANDTKLIVKFLKICFYIFGLKVVDKPFPNVTGTWRLSYLDDDFRILYTLGGSNLVSESLFILSKL